MDPLSEVLRSVRLTGGVFLAPGSPPRGASTSRVRPGRAGASGGAAPAQLIAFHVVSSRGGLLNLGRRGACRSRCAPAKYSCFCATTSTRLASAAGLRSVNASTTHPAPGRGRPARILTAAAARRRMSSVVFLASEEGYNPLIAALPRRADARRSRGHVARLDRGLRPLCRRRTRGQAASASSSVMSRLSERCWSRRSATIVDARATRPAG